LIKDFIPLSNQKGSAKSQSPKVLCRFGENDFFTVMNSPFLAQEAQESAF
jgi:hypothetical protein